MKVSAFTYIRNGFSFDYPFLQAIESVLPLVDEFIVVVGDSYDDTRQAVQAINNFDKKIKIVDTIWDDKMRAGGYIFAQQANIGLDNVAKDSDWVFHIQADEVIHEKDYSSITNAMKAHLNNLEVEGLLFGFINFFGDYNHYAPSRRFHQKEIRVVRNNPAIRSYNDSQGFRKYNNPTNTSAEKGEKLNVKKIDASVYHYSYVKAPEMQFKKHLEFGNRWHADDNWQAEMKKENNNAFNYQNIDYLKKFEGTHPTVMLQKKAAQNWQFHYNAAINNMTPREKVLKFLETIFKKQFFIYKNYKLLK
jgi:hypothetical protein